MDTKSQQQKWQDSTLSSLNVAIGALELAKEISSITPAKVVFGSVSVLTMIKVHSSSAMKCSAFTHNQDSMANELDYVELGLSCADICRALDRGMNGRRLDEFSRSVRDATGQLTTRVEPAIHIPNPSTNHAIDPRTVAEIQRKIIERGGRDAASRLLHAKNDGEAIAAWNVGMLG